MSSARASAEMFPPKYARASDLLITQHYGETHMGLHIGNFYHPATFDYMDQAGQRIRAMRKALGLNQDELAGKVGVDQSTISDIERGAGFSADLLMRFVQHLGGTAALIMRGSDDAVWPFPHVPIERFLALDAKDRGYVEGKLSAALDEVEQVKPEDLAAFEASHGRQAKPRQKRRAA